VTILKQPRLTSTTPIECGNVQFRQDSCLKPEQDAWYM